VTLRLFAYVSEGAEHRSLKAVGWCGDETTQTFSRRPPLCSSHLYCLRKRSRDRLDDSLRFIARESLNEPAAGRLIFEIEIGEGDAARVFDDVGFGASTDAQRKDDRLSIGDLQNTKNRASLVMNARSLRIKIASGRQFRLTTGSPKMSFKLVIELRWGKLRLTLSLAR
jgi:hypothetical protein